MSEAVPHSRIAVEISEYECTDEIHDNTAIWEPAGGAVKEAVLPIRLVVSPALQGRLDVVVVACVDRRVPEHEQSPLLPLLGIDPISFRRDDDKEQ